MGYRAALLSVLVNAGTLFCFGYLQSKGAWGLSFASFESVPAMVTSMATFVLLNAMASISVSVLLAGIARSNEKEKKLLSSLTKEKQRLITVRDRLQREIQDHRQTGERLRKSERKYRKLFNQAPAGMYEIDFVRFKFLAVNDLLCRFSGYTREEFLEMNPVDFLSTDDRERFLDRFERLKNGENVSSDAEYRVNGKDGRRLNVLLQNDYIYEAGKLTGARVVVQDLTQRKKIEEMMIQSEKMISVGGLAAGMAHEINNPLAGILQNTQVIENRLTRELPANDRAASDLGTSMPVIRRFMEERGVLAQLGRIKEAGNRAAQIVENMLSFSRKTSAVKTEEDLSELIAQSLDLIKSDYRLNRDCHFRQIKLVREFMPGPHRILCEKSKIQQVIFNLVKNACQAMADAGQTSPRLLFRLNSEPGMVRMEIEDNGPGIVPSVRKRIFEPFYTTKEIGSGTGLGLSVSYFIVVQDHGGEMHVRSKTGRGTRFIVKLPAI